MKLDVGAENSLQVVNGLLYRATAPFGSGYLATGGDHEIYYEQSGREDGAPVVLLHGGPGSGSSPITPCFFDPDFFRIISFDQRGAGRSRPPGCILANTTEHLLADMEALRQHLRLSSWIVSGGSWGATLALAYGVAYPARCLGFLLRSVALGRADEFHWWATGMRYFFPESWQRFAEHVEEDERGDLLGAYGKKLASSDPRISGPAAIEWHRYEGACGSLLPTRSRKLGGATTDQLIHMARIESHYFLNNAFLADNWLLDNSANFNHLPGAIVHGRYDVISPPKAAYELAAGWPGVILRIVDAAGHLPTEYRLAKAFLEEIECAKRWYAWPPGAGSS